MTMILPWLGRDKHQIRVIEVMDLSIATREYIQ